MAEAGRGMGGALQIAVVGEGLTAAALTLALAHTARGYLRALETLLYAGGGARGGTPRIVTPQCRARLALLGCSVPAAEPTVPLIGMRVLSRSARSWLAYPPGVVTLGAPGRDVLTETLTARASLAGAHVRPWTVERTEALSPARSPGRVLRCHGLVARADLVVLALEPGDASSAAAEPKWRAPLLAGAEAWLTTRRVPPYAQLLLAPTPGVDALLLLPVPGGVYALGFGGAALEVVDLSLLLVEAAADGLLETGFALRAAGRRQLPAGAAGWLTGPGTLAIGPDALGHPLDLSLAPTLALATRAAKALVSAPEPPRSLVRALVEVGINRTRAETRAAAGLWRTLRRAGPEAAHLFRASRAAPARIAEGTLAGLERLQIRKVRRAAQWEALRELFLPRSPLPRFATVLLQPPRQPRLLYVVDDDWASRESICEQLQLVGAEVERFDSELDLLAAVAHRPPAAVLLDVVLERVDGIRLCRALVSHPATRGTPVYLMSGMPGATMRRQALEAGATAFLTKPLDSAAFALLSQRHRLSTPGPDYRIGTPASSHTAA